MLEELRIMGFRRYDNLNLRNLGKINFILGENNVGKTTILEAVFTWACGQNMPPMISIPLARGRYGGLQNLSYWEMEELLAVIHDKNTVPFHMRFEGMVNGRKESFSHRIVPSDLLSA
jgi:ABC-type cobalamin/Fe3+-siderophores transport system ATPase subunit